MKSFNKICELKGSLLGKIRRGTKRNVMNRNCKM